MDEKRKFLDYTGLRKIYDQLIKCFNKKVDKIDGKGLSTNDFDNASKNKLNNLASTIGTTNISNIGNGTVSGAISSLNTDLVGKQATITGAASSIVTNNLAASRALVSNSSGKVTVSAVTATELGYLSGITSNVQAQINALSGWIDLTTSCNWHVIVTATGPYRTFVRYNKITRQVIGAIYTESAVSNQQQIVTMPSLEGIGFNPYTGMCGIGYTTDVNMSVNPRVSGNVIYSSHSTATNTGKHTLYLINFVAA